MKHRWIIIGSFLAVVSSAVFFVCSLTARRVMTVASSYSGTPVIVIDAGHGGEDGGAVSITGIAESTINLQIAKRLEHMLAFCGVKNHMTRHDENAVHTEGNTIRERKISDLRNRVNMINGFDRAILISIHQNHYPEEKYFGVQVFYADTGGSKELASVTQKVLQQALDLPQIRQIKKAESTYLMQKINCTGVLVECGFLSNQREEILLQDSSYQKRIACALGCSIAQYLEQGSENIEI